MSDEQVKGIPEDLRGIYDHASQFAGHMGDHQTVDGMICRLIERIASSEQALADQYHAASQFADAIVRMDAEKVKHKQALAALEARNRELADDVDVIAECDACPLCRGRARVIAAKARKQESSR